MADVRAIYDLKAAKYVTRGRTIPPSADARYRRSIVERLIYHEVLRQEAAALGVTIDQAELAAREAQQRRGITDWALHLERRGETHASLREMYIAELREQAILKRLGKLELTRAEIEADYEKIKNNWRSDQRRVRASHIFIATAEPSAGVRPGDSPLTPDPTVRTPAEAEAKARKVYALAKKKGADFAALAREHGEGPSAAQGGDIGIFTADRMAGEFATAAFEMKVGQISKPVKTKFGWHIIKVTGRWPPGVLPLSALEDQIVSRLQQRKLQDGRRALKEDLLRRYAIVDHVAPTLRR
jgi:peptidyl-prolyl cis-trans isomerase C